jgi:cell wall-associated NlpC family hydrolase
MRGSRRSPAGSSPRAGTEDNLRAGDQLFFTNSRGKTYHTGIAINNRYFIHSSGPCVQISCFDPDDPLYDPEYTENFFLGKRP